MSLEAWNKDFSRERWDRLQFGIHSNHTPVNALYKLNKKHKYIHTAFYHRIRLPTTNQYLLIAIPQDITSSLGREIVGKAENVSRGTRLLIQRISHTSSTEHRAYSTAFAVEIAEASYWSIGHNGNLLPSLATRQTVNLEYLPFLWKHLVFDTPKNSVCWILEWVTATYSFTCHTTPWIGVSSGVIIACMDHYVLYNWSNSHQPNAFTNPRNPLRLLIKL